MKFLRSSSGNMGIMLAVATVPLMIAVGVAVDMVRANDTQTVLSGAADAAALAGATSGKVNDAAFLEKTVRSYLKANDALLALKSVTTITQNVDLSSATFKVVIKGKIATTFMALAGFDNIDLAAEANVNLGLQSLEVALALDNTGSMAGQKIIDLQASAKELVATLESEKASYSSLKFSLVPFAQYVSVGTGNAGEPWLSAIPAGWAGCVGSRPSPEDEMAGTGATPFPALAGVPCQASITPLTSNVAAINAGIDAMVAANSTYVPGGLLWGWNALDSAAPFTEGLSKTQMKAVNGRKVLVLMTDGWNTASPLYPDHTGNDTAYSDAKLTTMCNNVKGDGIELFTVAFQVPSPSMKALLVDCASGTDHAFEAGSGTALHDAFSKIGQMMASVRLTK
jgi:Flp pilus assembly protein TadG